MELYLLGLVSPKEHFSDDFHFLTDKLNANPIGFFFNWDFDTFYNSWSRINAQDILPALDSIENAYPWDSKNIHEQWAHFQFWKETHVPTKVKTSPCFQMKTIYL